MSFSSVSLIKAKRKAARCDACGRMVEVGNPAYRWAGTTDGDFGTLLYHPDCRAAELVLNELHGTWSNDEWLGLWDFDWEDAEWLLHDFPQVAARKGITAETVADWQARQSRFWSASADTRPQGGDCLQAPFTSGAVPKADAQ